MSADNLLQSILDASELGLVLLDSSRRVLLWNQWMSTASAIDPEQAVGHSINEIFGESMSPRISQAVDDALQRHMSAVLSSSLNKRLLPLYRDNPAQAERDPIKQFIVVKPLDIDGRKQCLLQISDITSAETREKVLRQQARTMQVLAEEHRARDIHLQAILDNTAEAILSFDSASIVHTFNAATLRIFGYGAEEIDGSKVGLLFPELASQSASSPAMLGQFVGNRHQTFARRKDHSVLPIELSIGALELAGETHYVAVAHDITLRKTAEEESRQQQEWLTTLINTLPDIVCLKDGKGRWLVVNRIYKKLLGLEHFDPIGLTSSEIKRLCPNLKDYFSHNKHTDELAWEQGSSFNFEYDMVMADGDHRIIDFLKTPLFNADGSRKGLVEVGRDVTERKNSAARIQHLAHHDGLTELPNRMLFQERLREAVEQSRRGGTQAALILLDLDKFKDINDTLGHHVGDLLLGTVARRLRGCVRQTDTVARLGGDEFAVLLAHVSSADGASTVADSILTAVAEPITLDDNEIIGSASLGITIFPDDGVEPEQLLKNADLALYRSKSEGRARYHFYVAEMDEEVQKRKSIERELRTALLGDQLSLVYQPLIDLKTGEVSGAEALVRWTHPTRGDISPAIFIPIAERNDLIFRIGRWVLEQVCMQIRSWQKEGLNPPRVAVNLSPAQFRHTELLDMIKSVIAETVVSPESLQLEITETIAMTNFDYSIEILKELRSLGLSIAIDDFGTGYSSLNYLKHFPVDKLKIDRSFITDLGHHPENAAIVRAIIALGHGIGVRVNVEGIETLEQLRFMRDHDCDECQGFYFSEPLTADAYAFLLRNAKPWEYSKFHPEFLMKTV